MDNPKSSLLSRTHFTQTPILLLRSSTLHLQTTSIFSFCLKESRSFSHKLYYLPWLVYLTNMVTFHFKGTYFVPGSMLSALYALLHWLLARKYYSYFTEEETETQRDMQHTQAQVVQFKSPGFKHDANIFSCNYLLWFKWTTHVLMPGPYILGSHRQCWWGWKPLKMLSRTYLDCSGREEETQGP